LDFEDSLFMGSFDECKVASLEADINDDGHRDSSDEVGAGWRVNRFLNGRLNVSREAFMPHGDMVFSRVLGEEQIEVKK
jgi:hypothetical protein